MIVFAVLGWIIPGNIFGSDSADAFMMACIPVIVFYVNLWRKEKGDDKKGMVLCCLSLPYLLSSGQFIIKTQQV
jgi:hypothetical protein